MSSERPPSKLIFVFNDQNTHQPYVHESFLLFLLSDQYHDIIKNDSKLVRYVVDNKT